MKIHPAVNISQVQPYKECLSGQTTYKPGPIQVSDEEDNLYKVKYIVDSCLKGQHLKFLIHWKGYSDKDRMWKPESALSLVKRLFLTSILLIQMHYKSFK